MNKETKGMLIAFGRASLAGIVALAYLSYKKEEMPSKVDFVKFVVIALGGLYLDFLFLLLLQ